LKALSIISLLFISSLSWAQNIQDFNGDYTLNFAVSACNPNARVEINNQKIKIINQDPRDNRGWSTTELKMGESTYVLANGNKIVTTVKLNKTEVVVSKSIQNNRGKETAFEKDLYTFSNKNGKKSLTISLAVEVKGNLAGWPTTCGYEKK
jgi:hypothetical protein